MEQLELELAFTPQINKPTHRDVSSNPPCPPDCWDSKDIARILVFLTDVLKPFPGGCVKKKRKHFNFTFQMYLFRGVVSNIAAK